MGVKNNKKTFNFAGGPIDDIVCLDKRVFNTTQALFLTL